MLDNRDIANLTRALELHFERSLGINLRSFRSEVSRMQDDVRYIRTEIDSLKNSFTNLGSVLNELRQESEQAKHADYKEQTDLTVVKEQLLRLQSDLQVLLKAFQPTAGGQSPSEKEKIFQ